jgi:integrase
MARPRLQPGEWGTIGYSWTGDRVRAYALYRFADGTTSKRERWGDSEIEAERELVKYFRSLARADDQLDRTSCVQDVAAAWIAEIKRTEKATTSIRYETCLKCQVLPALGALRLDECRPKRIQALLNDMRDAGYSASTRRTTRTVVRAVLHYAKMHELVDANAASELDRIKDTTRRRVRGFDAAGLREFLAKVDADRYMKRSYLPDLLRFLFGTACRLGEVLAVRWRDVNLSDEPVKVFDDVFGEQVIPPRAIWINGNIVNVRGKVLRHDGKTGASEGSIGLPGFLHTLLQFRMPDDVRPEDPVFPNSRGGWSDPNSVWRSVRRLRERIGYPDFVLHWGRKTVATALYQSGQSTGAVADQLRQASIATTEKHYLMRGLANPEAAAIIDGLLAPTT